MKIEINTYDDLLEFLDRDGITLEQATYVSSQVLKVWNDPKTLEQHRKEVRQYIKEWGYKGDIEKPLFYGN